MNSYKKYKIGVIKWHTYLQLDIPNDYQIAIRWMFNDLYRWMTCKFFLYNRLVNENKKLRLENNEYRKQKTMHDKVWKGLYVLKYRGL